MKQFELVGKWVLVTGASSGLGREMARVLAERGANTVLVARRQERLEALAQELRATGRQVRVLPADLSRISEVDRVADELLSNSEQPLGAAILNAGITHFGKWDELSWEGYERLQALNVTGVVRMTHRLLPALEQRHDNAAFMVVSSMLGLMPAPYQTAYSATKAFLVHFGAGLHHEMWSRGVSVTTFCPGGVDTEMTATESFGKLRGWLMPAPRCAKDAVDAMCHRAYVRQPGLMYRASAVAARWMPQRFLHGRIGAQYLSSLRAAGE